MLSDLILNNDCKAPWFAPSIRTKGYKSLISNHQALVIHILDLYVLSMHDAK